MRCTVIYIIYTFPSSGDLARLTEWAERVVEEGVVEARREPRFSQTTLLLRPVGNDVKRSCNVRDGPAVPCSVLYCTNVLF